MKLSKKILLSAVMVSLTYGLSASAAQSCQSTASVNGQTYTSDKCNVSIVNGQVTFSDDPPAIPAPQLPSVKIPQLPSGQAPAAPAGLPSYLQNFLKGLY